MSKMTPHRSGPRLRLLVLAIALSAGAPPALAQEMDHSKMHMPPTAAAVKKKPAAKKPVLRKAAAKKPADAPAAKPATTADPHAGHTMPAPAPTTAADDHAAMGHVMPAPSDQPREPIPVLSDADRIAAFPDVAGHAAHDRAIHSLWALDRLETWNTGEGTGVAWEALSWIGTDLNRVWLRSEGERVGGSTESADIEVLYGRSVGRWWDLVAGVRHDFGEGPSQTFAALGVMGLAPYKFEFAATAYLGQSGQTAARLEIEYDTLLSNRLILRWQAEADFHGQNDELRGIGSGVSTIEASLLLRYEFTRRFAPYVGVVRERAYGGTADFRRAHLDDVNDTRFVAGLRIWF